MAGNLQPLDEKFPIVGADGRPTLYFIKWAQQRQIDITESITLQGLEDYLAAHKLQEGSGIQFTPDGNIANSPIIAADVQEILDQVTSTQGSILYRGLLGWAALVPGTAGWFLKTQGAGADPIWAAAPGAGGGNPYEASPVAPQPAVADFTWNNQGTGTAVASAMGGIVMNSTTVGINLRQLEKNLPAAPFSIYCNLRHLAAVRNNSNQAGIHLRNSTNGRVMFFCVNPGNSTAYNILTQNWTNVTTFSANVTSMIAWEEIHWLRLDITATAYTAWISQNGKDWVQFSAANVLFSSFLTAAGGGTVDKYGITLQNNANPYHVWFTSFGLTAP